MSQHVHIVGAGVIGLAAAVTLAARGMVVTLIDRGGPGEATSRGNAGGLAWTDVAPMASPGIMRQVPGWLLDPLGPLAIRPAHLLRAMPWLWGFLRASTPDRHEAGIRAITALHALTHAAWPRLAKTAGIEDCIRPTGCLDLFGSLALLERQRPAYARQRAAGIEVEEVAGSELAQLEPALGPRAVAGALIPGWSQVTDPFEVCRRLFDNATARGVAFEHGDVQAVGEEAGRPVLHLDGAAPRPVERLVIACGAWSGRLVPERVPLESERGYNLTVPAPGIGLDRLLYIHGHGFVVAPLSCGLRIGGAVELAGLDAPPNWKRVEALVAKARLFLPDLDASSGTRWMGHRPSLPDSLPVIGASTRLPATWYAFGHSHHGLTQAAATAEILADLMQARTPGLAIEPYAVGRF